FLNVSQQTKPDGETAAESKPNMLAISRRSAAPQPGGAQSDLPMTANRSPMVRARICSRNRGLMRKLPTPKAAMPGGNFAFKSLAIVRGLPQSQRARFFDR